MNKRPLKEWLDMLCADFFWYRKLRGGVWYQVRVLLLQDCFLAWVRKPLEFETVITMEIY